MGKSFKNEACGGGVQHFFEWISNPILSLCTPFLLVNVWAKPYYYVVKKKLLSYILNGLIANFEKNPLLPLLVRICVSKYTKILPFFCRCSLDYVITSEGIVDFGLRWPNAYFII